MSVRTLRRFIAKPYSGSGRRVTFGVYDTEVGSWPQARPEPFGLIKQETTEAEAQAEADRLEALYRGRQL